MDDELQCRQVDYWINLTSTVSIHVIYVLVICDLLIFNFRHYRDIFKVSKITRTGVFIEMKRVN